MDLIRFRLTIKNCNFLAMFGPKKRETVVHKTYEDLAFVVIYPVVELSVFG